MIRIKFEYQITIIYILFGGLWILASDEIAISISGNDSHLLSKIQNYKGWFYVAITGLFLYLWSKKNNEKLRKSEFEARENDRLKSSFIQNISHEIRTPMNGIIGFSTLLKTENISNEKRAEYVNIINKCTAQLLSIVDSMLEISMLETDIIKPKKTSVNLSIFMDELYLYYKPLIAKEITFNLQKDSTPNNLFFETDEFRLRQIFDNILANAIKFTKSGNITIGYTIENNAIRFYVEDSGIGIKQEHTEIIFDRFRQSDVNLNKEYGGMGLGLAISKGLVTLLGGKIWVKSIVNQGSTFYFSIPIELPQNQNGEKSKNDSYQKLIGKTILVVEDEEVNYLYIKELLQKLNIQLLRANNGEEAVAICKQNNMIDIVLMDIKMPKMNGYDATKEIRDIRPNLIIIAQTAYAAKNNNESSVIGGFNDFISKPFDKDILISKMNNLLT